MNAPLSHLVRAAAAGPHLRARADFPTAKSLRTGNTASPSFGFTGIRTVRIRWRRIHGFVPSTLLLSRNGPGKQPAGAVRRMTAFSYCHRPQSRRPEWLSVLMFLIAVF
jgi:hypothetical protein